VNKKIALVVIAWSMLAYGQVVPMLHSTFKDDVPVNTTVDIHSDTLTAITQLATRDTMRQIEMPPAMALDTSEHARTKVNLLHTILQNLPELAGVYNAFLRTNPDLHGQINVSLGIADNGKVSYCSVHDSNVGNHAFEQAILSKIKTWVFDRGTDMSEIIYPFVFNPTTNGAQR